jgi:hypothetical protein
MSNEPNCQTIVQFHRLNGDVFHIGEFDDGRWRFCEPPIQGEIDISHLGKKGSTNGEMDSHSGLFVANGPTPPSDWFKLSFSSKDEILGFLKTKTGDAGTGS